MAYKKVFYTRRYQPLPPALDHTTFPDLLKKRKLEELRLALVNGDLEEQQPDSPQETDDEESNASTSCTASPRSSRLAAQEVLTEAELTAQRQQQEAQAAAEREAQLARRKAEDELLKSIYAKLQEQQAAEAAEKLAARHELEEQHASASQQISDIQQRLDQLKEAKHTLVKQLKQAMQAEQAAKQQQAALQQQQQMQLLMQQQQEQWQQQQQQLQQQQQGFRGLTPLGIPAGTPGPYSMNMTPRAEGFTSPAGFTPGYNTGPTPTGGLAQGPNTAGFTPRGGLVSPPGAARSQWLFSTPAQPPPPPPRHQQQQPLSEYQLKQHISDSAISGTHGPLHGSAPAAGHQQHQHQQHQQQGGRRGPSWGQLTLRPGEQQQQQYAHAGGSADVHMHDRLGEQQRQQEWHYQHQHGSPGDDRPPQQQHRWQDHGPARPGEAVAGAAGAADANRVSSPKQGQGSGVHGASAGLRSPGKQHRHRDWHHQYAAPDSPEEGEALPSPQPLHLKVPGVHLDTAARQQPAGAAASDVAHADRAVPGHVDDRDRADLGYTGFGTVRRTSSGSGYLDRPDRVPAGAGLLRTGSGGGFGVDRAAAVERPGLLRTSSTGGGPSGHIVSPPSSGGSLRGGTGALGRSMSAAVDARGGQGDRLGLMDRDRDASSRQRTQQGYYSGRGGRGGDESGQHTWRGERRRSGTQSEGAYAAGDAQNRQHTAGLDRPADAGDRSWSRGTEGGVSGRGLAPSSGPQQGEAPGASGRKGWSRNPGAGRGREGGFQSWK